MTNTVEILEHYRRKGLTGAELRAAISRHARLLETFDPDVADALLDAPLNPVLAGRAE